MKTYNKLPFKERQRQLKYSYTQTERQEELAFKREIKRLEESKREQEYTTEKDRDAQGAYERLKELEKRHGTN